MSPEGPSLNRACTRNFRIAIQVRIQYFIYTNASRGFGALKRYPAREFFMKLFMISGKRIIFVLVLSMTVLSSTEASL
jgi:hypothetical protein